jgi:hypothetical protein
MKVSGVSLISCDVCITSVLFVIYLVSGFLGALVSSGENWSFFPFLLAY